MSARRKFPPLRWIVILALLVAAACYILPRITAAPPAAKAPPIPKVTVTTAHRTDIPLYFDYAARLAGSREVEIRARVGGILQKRAYTEGQHVAQGALLFQIDPAPYEAALSEAKATYTQAHKDWTRAEALNKDKAISPRELEQAQAAYGQAKAALETAKINLSYTTVRAPISGYTSKEGFSEGSLVAADSSLLTRLTQLDPIYVEFAYPDTEAASLRAGFAKGELSLPPDGILKAEIRLDNGVIYPVEGQIRFTDTIIDTSTGTVRARAVLPNKEHGIIPGQFVRVTVKGITQKTAIAVPEQAILQGPQGTFVYTVTPEGIAKPTPVTLGRVNRGLQIITSGLNEGDQVITEGMIKVKPDSPVTIDTGAGPEPAAMPPAPAKAS